jgi:phosphatidylinositol-4-phosphate 5-kinase-like protein 1
MQSVFWPSSRIREKFDLKGCLKGRYQPPRPDADPINVVLKDVNFGDRGLVLGQIAPW